MESCNSLYRNSKITNLKLLLGIPFLKCLDQLPWICPLTGKYSISLCILKLLLQLRKFMWGQSEHSDNRSLDGTIMIHRNIILLRLDFRRNFLLCISSIILSRALSKVFWKIKIDPLPLIGLWRDYPRDTEQKISSAV